MTRSFASGMVVFFPVVGGMLTLGIFVLPAVAFHGTGPVLLVSYLLASLLMIPTALSMAELGTAMPGEGGAYFYVSRSMGPMLGFFAGLAKWFALGLKGAFALSSVGVIVQLYWPTALDWQLRAVVLLTLLLLLLLEVITKGRTGFCYTLLTMVVIGCLLVYLFVSAGTLKWTYLNRASDIDLVELLQVTGMVSLAFYEGLIKIALFSGQMKSPGKSVPMLIFSAFLVVAVFYLLIIAFTLANLSPEEFANSPLPLARVMELRWGPLGMGAMAAVALLAFLLAASQSLVGAAHVPQAMAQDGLLPQWLAKGNRRGFALNGHLVTALLMAMAIAFFDLSLLVKIASGMLLLLFTLMNLAVIILRESRIVAYRPTYHAPFYPLNQVVGILASLILIFEIGNGPLLTTLGFFVISSLVYLAGGRKGRSNNDALWHLVTRMAARELGGGERLNDELARILKQRDSIEEDRFDRLIRQAIVLDVQRTMTREALFNKLASAVALKTDLPVVSLYYRLEEREKQSTTLLSPTLAVPHLIFADSGLDFIITIVRCLPGIHFSAESDKVHTVFCLAGSPEDRNFHLKALMHIAQIVQDPQFQRDWLNARDEEELRNAILLAKRQRGAS